MIGLLVCDRLETQLQPTPELDERMWPRREIENYLCQPETLLSYAQSSSEETGVGPLFARSEAERRRTIMQECVDDFVPRVATRDRRDAWWVNTKGE